MVAQYNAAQLLTMREVVSKDIRRILGDRARYFGIILEDVSITALTFSKEYTAAVEAKQVAQQEAERAKFIVDRAVQDKQSSIVRAQGEAQSARLIGQAIQQNPAFIALRKIEVGRRGVGVWVCGRGLQRQLQQQPPEWVACATLPGLAFLLTLPHSHLLPPLAPHRRRARSPAPSPAAPTACTSTPRA